MQSPLPNQSTTLPLRTTRPAVARTSANDARTRGLYASVSRHHSQQACALAASCLMNTRFHNGDCVPCMWITMATRDRPFDVTTTPVDVSNRVIDMVWCDRTCESRHSTANAVLCTQSREGNAQCITTTSFKLPNVHAQVQLLRETNEAC